MHPALLSVPRGGEGEGGEGRRERGGDRRDTTHTQPGLLGDRTSGFNGLRTQCPPGLHEGRRGGRG